LFFSKGSTDMTKEPNLTSPVPPSFYRDGLTPEDEEFVARIYAKAAAWEASPEGQATRKAAEEAHAKSGNLGDFIGIMLGGTKIKKATS
jgi:hypothetical protein